MVLPDEQLADLAVKANLADAKKLVEAYTYVKLSNVSLEDALLELKITTDDQLGQAVAAYLKVPFVSLSKVSIPEDVFDLVPPVVARKQKAVAFGPVGKKTRPKILRPLPHFPGFPKSPAPVKKNFQGGVRHFLKGSICQPT